MSFKKLVIWAESIGRSFGFRWSLLSATFYRFGGLIMTIASLKWSQKATDMRREVLASNDVRTLIANQLGVDVKRVTDEAHFTDDLGADWLDRLELMIVIEDRFADVVITDEEVDQLEVVGDLIRHIENVDHEGRRRSIVEATTMPNNTNRPRTWPQSCHWK